MTLRATASSKGVPNYVAAAAFATRDQMTSELKGSTHLGQRLDGHDCLTSIEGIGDYSAAVLLSIIGDVNDFADENKLASYFGIVPKVADSNQTERHGRITKRGSKLGRLVLGAR
ncbi:MAG: transposase [Acidobacteriota bacterium]|jgi:transposase|nr:transposase [Acidobacteriota bacterium]